jgi:adenine/guanine phosphoribosyltransferase-like PRPP-binding protein
LSKRSPALVLELCKAGVIRPEKKGIKVDTSVIATEPNLRSFIIGEWASLIQAASVEAIVGLAPLGASFAALLAEKLGISFAVIQCLGGDCRVYGRVRGRRVALVSDTSDRESDILDSVRELLSSGARVVLVSVIIDMDSAALKRSLRTHYAPLVRARDITKICSSAFGG